MRNSGESGHNGETERQKKVSVRTVARTFRMLRPDQMPVNHDLRRQLGKCRSNNGATCSQRNRNAHGPIIVLNCLMAVCCSPHLWWLGEPRTLVVFWPTDVPMRRRSACLEDRLHVPVADRAVMQCAKPTVFPPIRQLMRPQLQIRWREGPHSPSHRVPTTRTPARIEERPRPTILPRLDRRTGLIHRQGRNVS